MAWNWFYFGRWINACKCKFPKKMPEMCGWRRTTLPSSHIIRFVIWLFFFVILLNCRPPCSGGIVLYLPVGTWAISGYHRWPQCYGRHLSEKHCTIYYSQNANQSDNRVEKVVKGDQHFVHIHTRTDTHTRACAPTHTHAHTPGGPFYKFCFAANK